MRAIIAGLAVLVVSCLCVAAENVLQLHDVATLNALPSADVGRNCSGHLAQQKMIKMAGAWFPTCEADGTYAALQVHDNAMQTKPYTACVSKGGKEIIKGTQIQACQCPRERWEGEENQKRHIIGGFIPSCNDTTGTYSPRQMHGGTGFSWCSDEAGKQTSTPLRGKLTGC